jgi:hypothetical protein
MAIAGWSSIWTNARCHTSRRYSNMPFSGAAEHRVPSRRDNPTNDVGMMLANGEDWWKHGRVLSLCPSAL